MRAIKDVLYLMRFLLLESIEMGSSYGCALLDKSVKENINQNRILIMEAQLLEAQSKTNKQTNIHSNINVK